jgi:rod shape-determining protein MreC
VQIDAGSSDGVRVDQPVVTDGGLVGRVTSVTGGTATITLIVDASSAVSAQVLPDGKFGVVRPKVGNPNDMRLEYLDKNTKVEKGDLVITSGSTDEKLESLFPKGIPIGRVSRVDPDELDVYERIHIEPFADFKRMEFVQVLRANPQPDPQTEQAPNGSSGQGQEAP